MQQKIFQTQKKGEILSAELKKVIQIEYEWKGAGLNYYTGVSLYGQSV